MSNPETKVEVHVFTERHLSAALTEWERRYREEPERFMNESQRLAISPDTYGDSCAPYLISILNEQNP